MRLSLALNTSVFYYDIRDLPENSFHMAQQAFDDTIANLDSLTEDSFRESTRAMQLLEKELAVSEGPGVVEDLVSETTDTTY